MSDMKCEEVGVLYGIGVKNAKHGVIKPVIIEDIVKRGFEFVKQYVFESDDPEWVEDWSDQNQKKHYIYYNYPTKDWNSFHQLQANNNSVYMSEKCAVELVKILNKDYKS